MPPEKFNQYLEVMAAPAPMHLTVQELRNQLRAYADKGYAIPSLYLKKAYLAESLKACWLTEVELG